MRRREAKLALTASLYRDQPPELGMLSYGSTDGRLGVNGRSVSMVVERDDLPEPYRAAIDGPFTFDARAFNDDFNQPAGTPSYP